ncbi:GNAT family N-acetyltransferase [Hyphomicrobium sp.]|uniref:GNAT family N-acetyltransferase n=1 Tax=Hyphomicrobium sp. TaxID=82 RepID=UPI002E2F2644|nr:GNAT family N-acetyltransferase [Hyphomicrobium sp.]HEX2840008.1 GNAT family N-acetyltransferase [Hyphomicrobium sp.]
MDAIEIASGIDAVARLHLLWKEAGARAGGLGAFDQFDLVVAAAHIATQSGAEPLVAIFRREGRVKTVLPLRRERRLGARIAVPLVYPLAQYTNVVGEPLAPHELPPLCKTLSEKGLDILLLRKVRADSGLFEALSQNAQSQNAVETALYIDLSAYPNFASYEATFSNRTQRNRRQRRQRLEAAAGPLTFDVLRGNDAMAAFDTALAWKRLWLAERGVSSPVFDSGAWEDLLRSTVTSGSAIVTALRAGESFAAVEVGFADRKTYVSYLGAFDPTLSAHSPGQEQMRRTIAWCFEQGFARYDLLAPADDYKRQWARTDTGVAVDDYAIALTPVGRGMAEIRRHIRPLARDIYHSLSPEMRVAGGRYGKPAAAAAAAMCAGAVIAALE